MFDHIIILIIINHTLCKAQMYICYEAEKKSAKLEQ